MSETSKICRGALRLGAMTGEIKTNMPQRLLQGSF